MRDLIRNYKLIIKRRENVDSDSDILSSSNDDYISSMEASQTTIFVQNACSSGSEDFTVKNNNKYGEKETRETLLKNDYDWNNKFSMDLINEKLYLNEGPTENTALISSSKIYLDDLPLGATLLECNKKNTNSSTVTIFAVWNTTVGTSLLAMAWGMEKSGLIPGIIINLLVVAICLYTAYILLKINEKYGMVGQNIEVPDLCRLLLGRWAEITSKIFSLIVLIGGDVVYWILMSNFLYDFVVFIYRYFNEAQDVVGDTVLCPKDIMINRTEKSYFYSSSSSFYYYWDLYSTVPILLAFLMYPILNLKSPTFFAKFNSLGTLSISYLIIFVAVKSFKWGVNIKSWGVEMEIKPTFCVLSGMLTMSYFIHNIIISIMRHNKHQNKNGRDLSIAFGLVAFTYIFLGAAFYISFPLKKSCIEDNLLNNFHKTDLMALIARILLFFQLFTVFPFVTYMFRNEILTCISMISGKERHSEFTYTKTIIININIVFVCLMFACFFPKIGTLIRYTGALSGMIYIFIMPSCLKLASLRDDRRLTVTSLVIYLVIIVVGVLNLVAQFFVE